MKRKITEIYEGKEVFTNGRFSKFPTLDGIISSKESELNDLLSVRLSYDNASFDFIKQYNIETKNLITNFSTHNSLDIQMIQYNKNTKQKENYSPYSNPGYNVFVNLLIGYFEAFGKRPNINFKDIDIESRNKLRRLENPVSNFLESFRYNNGIYNYLYNKFLFKEDSNGIRCPIPFRKEIDNDDMEWVGFKGNETIMNLENYSYGYDNREGTMHKFVFENEFIPLYLQAVIDTNKEACGGGRSTVNLKKIYEMFFYVLENLESTNGDEDKITALVSESREKTPLS